MSTEKQGVLATRRCWLVYLGTASLLVLLTVALLSSGCCGVQQVRRHGRPRHLLHVLQHVSSTTSSSSTKAKLGAAAPPEVSSGSCVIGNCSVTCVDVVDIASQLESALDGSSWRNCRDLWKVNMTSCRFSTEDVDVLGRGWLPPTITRVGEVDLVRCSISAITDDAFEGPQFANTSILVVQSAAAVPSLSRAALAPLASSLVRLELRDLPSLASLEDGAVSQLHSLEELQLQQLPAASAALWINATGGDNVLANLKTLDLTVNHVGELRAEFLTGISTSVEQIFLGNSYVKTLQGPVFGVKFQKLRDIYLDHNHLTTIPEEAVNQPVYMYLEGNPWDCSCPLAWIQQYRPQIMDSPTCETPEELKGKKVKDLNVEDLCGNGSAATTTTTTTTTAAPSTATITVPPDFSSTTNPTTEPAQPPTSSVCVQRTPKEEEEEMASTTSILTLTEVNSYAVRLQVGPRFLNGSLVWVTYDNGSLVCYRHEPIRAASLVVDGLRPESSYAFCFSDPTRSFDPVDCVAHRTSALYENQSWIPNNKKSLVLGVGSASAVTTCVVIALGVYCALRRNPTLISKNVIVVKEFKDHVLVMPKNYVPAADRKRPSQESSSTASTSVATVQQLRDRRRKPPVKPRIASPPPRAEPVVLKSARAAAAASVGTSHNPTPRSSVSYVSVQEPTGAQKVGWRLRKAKHRIRTFFRGKPYNKLHNTEVFLEAVQPKSSYTLV